MPTDRARPLSSLLIRTLSDFGTLLQAEMQLARSETEEKLESLGSGVSQVAIGAGVLLAGLILVLIGIVRLLHVWGLPEQWGFLLVGLAVGAGGAFLIANGSEYFKGRVLMPRRTARQLKSDYSAIKEEIT